MEYLHELRKLVGHRPLLMVGTATLIVDGDGRLLMLKRTDSGCWGPPGGGLELGETVEESAKRETLEESGLEVGRMSLFGIFSGPGQFYVYPNGDEVYNIILVYLTRDFKGAVRLSVEHTDSGWFDVENIPGSISPPILPVLEKFKRGDLQP